MKTISRLLIAAFSMSATAGQAGSFAAAALVGEPERIAAVLARSDVIAIVVVTVAAALFVGGVVALVKKARS